MRERAQEAWQQTQDYKFETLVSDDRKLGRIDMINKNLKEMKDALITPEVPADVELPPLDTWLHAKGLGDTHAALEGWDLSTMLDSCSESTFETDFAHLPIPKRRKLQVALRKYVKEIQPCPPPSPDKPPVRVRPPCSGSGSSRSGESSGKSRPGGRGASFRAGWDDGVPGSPLHSACGRSASSYTGCPTDAMTDGGDEF